ncbi:hypothetical protein BH20ACT1_BH20ACT1_03440 [soil metagenome]
MTTPTDQRVEQRQVKVDPRLRARRQDVRREEGRRRLRWVQAGAVAAGTGAAVVAALLSPLLDVDRVVVEGVYGDRAAAVERAAEIDPGSPLITLDVGRVRTASEAVPWVDGVDVSRAWPTTVRISVSERRPAAVAKADDGTWVAFDVERQLAVLGAEELGTLPRVVGAVAEARPGAALDPAAVGALALSERLGATGTGVAEIVVDPSGELEVVLTGGVRVRFGRPVDLGEKAAALVALLAADAVAEVDEEEATSGRGTDRPRPVIDVRVAEAPVVTREGS